VSAFCNVAFLVDFIYDTDCKTCTGFQTRSSAVTQRPCDDAKYHFIFCKVKYIMVSNDDQ